jgi:hypothetical protein
MLAVSYRLFKRASDPLYRGLGLGLVLAICACIVANCFGDRWTYVEITAPLWVLLSAAIRAEQLERAETTSGETGNPRIGTVEPYMAYQ